MMFFKLLRKYANESEGIPSFLTDKDNTKHDPAIEVFLQSLSDDDRTEYEERIAIMEIDGELTQEQVMKFIQDVIDDELQRNVTVDDTITTEDSINDFG